MFDVTKQERNSCVTSRRCHAAPSSSCGNTATSRPLRSAVDDEAKIWDTPGSPQLSRQRRRRDRVGASPPRHFAKSQRSRSTPRFASSSSSAWSATSRPSPAREDIGERASLPMPAPDTSPSVSPSVSGSTWRASVELTRYEELRKSHDPIPRRGRDQHDERDAVDPARRRWCATTRRGDDDGAQGLEVISAGVTPAVANAGGGREQRHAAREAHELDIGQYLSLFPRFILFSFSTTEPGRSGVTLNSLL